MRPNFKSLESVKNSAYVVQNTNKFEQKEVPTQNYLKKHEVQFELLGPLGVEFLSSFCYQFLKFSMSALNLLFECVSF
jgi:hypothetical protein